MVSADNQARALWETMATRGGGGRWRNEGRVVLKHLTFIINAQLRSRPAQWETGAPIMCRGVATGQSILIGSVQSLMVDIDWLWPMFDDGQYSLA